MGKKSTLKNWSETNILRGAEKGTQGGSISRAERGLFLCIEKNSAFSAWILYCIFSRTRLMMVAFLFQFHSRYLSTKQLLLSSAKLLLFSELMELLEPLLSLFFMYPVRNTCVLYHLGVKKEILNLAACVLDLIEKLFPDPHSLRFQVLCRCSCQSRELKSWYFFCRTEAVTDREELPKVPSWKLTTFEERTLELTCALPATMLEPCPPTKLSFGFYVRTEIRFFFLWPQALKTFFFSSL